MPYFIKKPVIVQAVQWFKPGDHPSVITEQVQFDSTNKTHVLMAATPEAREQLSRGRSWIETLEGRMYVNPGDWIITGVAGEKHPCRSDIFDATYEEVDD